MAAQNVHSVARWAGALVVALCASAVAVPSFAATEIALRFHDDNSAARGAALSAVAQAAIETTAGNALIAAGRDTDGAFRFRFPGEPSIGDVRNALNRLRSTGALVYADIVSEDRGTLARQSTPRAGGPVTALIVRTKRANPDAFRTKLAFAKSGVAFAKVHSLADGAQVVQLVDALSPRDLRLAIARLEANPEVAHVEADRRATTQAQPSDPM